MARSQKVAVYKTPNKILVFEDTDDEIHRITLGTVGPALLSSCWKHGYWSTAQYTAPLSNRLRLWKKRLRQNDLQTESEIFYHCVLYSYASVLQRPQTLDDANYIQILVINFSKVKVPDLICKRPLITFSASLNRTIQTFLMSTPAIFRQSKWS